MLKRGYDGGSLSSQKNIEASANGSTWTSQYVQVWLTSQRNLVTKSFLNSTLSPSISTTADDRIPLDVGISTTSERALLHSLIINVEVECFLLLEHAQGSSIHSIFTRLSPAKI